MKEASLFALFICCLIIFGCNFGKLKTNERHNKFFNSQEITLSEEISNGNSVLIITVIDGKNIIEEESLKYLSLQFAKEVYSDLKKSYSAVIVAFRGNANPIKFSDNTIPADELRYEFLVESLE